MPSEIASPALLPLSEAAFRLRVSYARLHRQATLGEVPAIRQGRRIYVVAAYVEAAERDELQADAPPIRPGAA